uniref:Uncharacterized protein n=1 Tax=Ixodes ricinus TaxID=34613 RepID=A0A6B0V4V7_IXORI
MRPCMGSSTRSSLCLGTSWSWPPGCGGTWSSSACLGGARSTCRVTPSTSGTSNRTYSRRLFSAKGSPRTSDSSCRGTPMPTSLQSWPVQVEGSRLNRTCSTTRSRPSRPTTGTWWSAEDIALTQARWDAPNSFVVSMFVVFTVSWNVRSEAEAQSQASRRETVSLRVHPFYDAEKGKESALFFSPKYAKLCLMANVPWGIEGSIFVNSSYVMLKKYNASSHVVQNYIYRSLFKKMPNASWGIGR